MIYKRELTHAEIKALEHYVVDVTEWIDTAITEKIKSCQKRIIRTEIQNAIDNGLPIPTTADDVLAQVFKRDGYMTRKQREEKASLGESIKTSV